MNPEYLRTLTKVRPGDAVDIAAISQDATRMAALDDLDGVEYQLRGDPDNLVLTWKLQEKQIGPDYLRPSLGLYGGGAGDMQFELAVQHVRRWLNPEGGAVAQPVPDRLQLAHRDEPVSATGRRPDPLRGTRVAGTALARRCLQRQRAGRALLLHRHGRESRCRRELRQRRPGDAGILDLQASGGSGYRRRAHAHRVHDGRRLGPDGNIRHAGCGELRDHGIAAGIQYVGSNSALGAGRNWQRIEAAVRKSIPAGKMMLWLTAAGGTDLGSDLPPDQAFSLGGPQSFRGYEPGEIRAREYWTLDSAVLWRIADILPLANQTLYGGIACYRSNT